MDITDYDWERLLSLGYSEDTVKKVKSLPPTYKKGLTKDEQETAKREIKDTMQKAKTREVGTKELYEDWESDKSYNKRNKGKMPKSASTEAYKKMYGDHGEMDYAANAAQQAAIAINMKKEGKKPKSESEDHAEGTDKGLAAKAEASGIPLGILKKVFAKGMAAWRSGHRPGVAPQQWAMGRVNSFITGSGGARKADASLWKQAQAAKGKKD